MIHYPVAIFKDEGMNNYGAIIPDVAGCYPVGDTIDELMADVYSAVNDHIEVTLDEGLPFEFKSSKIEDLKNDPEYADAATWAIVSIDDSKFSTEQTRFNVSWPQYMLDRVDAHIANTHDTRSGFLAKAVQQAINQSPFANL